MFPLEDKLTELAKFGDPKLVKTNRGWWCYMEVFVTGKGVTVEVKGENGNETPRQAVDQCMERLEELMKSMRKTSLTFQTLSDGKS